MRLFRRHVDAQARAEEARLRAAEAEVEAEKSRTRYEVIQERVVKPLRAHSQHNQFADMIRASLTEENGR